MKKLILLLSLSLTLTACGGSSNNPPEGAAGLWVERVDADQSNNLNSFSLNNGECEPFFEDSGSPQFTGTTIENNGDMYILTINEFGTFSAETPLGSMNRDGFVTLNIPDEASELGLLPQIRFEMTGVDTAVGITTFEQGSLSVETDITELLKISPDEFEFLAGRVVRFCTR